MLLTVLTQVEQMQEWCSEMLSYINGIKKMY